MFLRRKVDIGGSSLISDPFWDPHQRVEELGDPHQRVEVRDPVHPSLLEQCDFQLKMGLCSSEIEMKSNISIIIKTGFRPLL